MSQQVEQNVLLADIGGTHIRFALYDGNEMGQVGIFRHEGEDAFDTAYRSFLPPEGPRPASMIIGAAGNVLDGHVVFSNKPTELSEKKLKERYNLALCRIVNDFELQAFAMPLLGKSDLVTLNNGLENETGPRCIIGPGTGLGVCFLSREESCVVTYPSEAGHTNLPLLSDDFETQEKIITYLNNRFSHVSIERVLSGKGLVYLAQALSNGHSAFDTPESVFQAALASDPIALKSYQMFFKYLGAFCADMALTFKTTGGVYLTGDILRQENVLKMLQQSDFINCFYNKGRFESFVRQVPVRLIRVPQTAFLGLKYLADHIIF